MKTLLKNRAPHYYNWEPSKFSKIIIFILSIKKHNKIYWWYMHKFHTGIFHG